MLIPTGCRDDVRYSSFPASTFFKYNLYLCGKHLRLYYSLYRYQLLEVAGMGILSSCRYICSTFSHLNRCLCFWTIYSFVSPSSSISWSVHEGRFLGWCPKDPSSIMGCPRKNLAWYVVFVHFLSSCICTLTLYIIWFKAISSSMHICSLFFLFVKYIYH